MIDFQDLPKMTFWSLKKIWKAETAKSCNTTQKRIVWVNWLCYKIFIDQIFLKLITASIIVNIRAVFKTGKQIEQNWLKPAATRARRRVPRGLFSPIKLFGFFKPRIFTNWKPTDTKQSNLKNGTLSKFSNFNQTHNEAAHDYFWLAFYYISCKSHNDKRK